MGNIDKGTHRECSGSLTEALLKIMLEEDFDSVVRKPRDYEPSEVVKNALDRAERAMINRRNNK